MLRNIFITAVRSIRKNKGISSINIVGLAISLTCFLLIFMWVADQLSYDRFFKNSNRIFRLNTEIQGKGTTVLSADNVSPALKQSYPEIVNSCRLFPSSLDIVVRHGDKEFFENEELSADPNFFDFFSFDVINGDRKTLLDSPNKVVLTESTALKIFGTINPVGKILTINPGDHKRELVVSGVVKDALSNSHLKFHFVTPLLNLPFWGNGWEYTILLTYVQLAENANAAQFEKKIGGFIKRFDKNSLYELHLQPLTDVHLYSSHLNDAARVSDTGDIKYLYIFAVAAFIILLLASTNFINMSIAGNFKKIKEAGVKKIIGATQRYLVFQFLGESILVVSFAAVISLAVIYWILPYFNQLFDIKLNLHLLDYKFVLGLLTVILFTGIISGSYPAFILSCTQPLSVLKNNHHKNFKAATVRKVLVIFQFTLSIGMIICVFVINGQMQFILEKNLGFNKDQVIYFIGHNLPSDPKEELLKIHSVRNVSWSSDLPLSVSNELRNTKWDGRTDDNVNLRYLRVDQDFIKTFDIRLKEGRNFSKELLTDEYSYMLNESAVKAMGLKSPVGKQLICLSGLGAEVPGTIIGVIKDFHSNSLHTKIEPLVIGMHIGKPWYVSVKINAGM